MAIATPIARKKILLGILSIGVSTGLAAYVFFWTFICLWTELYQTHPVFFITQSFTFIVEIVIAYYILKKFPASTGQLFSKKLNILSIFVLFNALHWGVMTANLLYILPLSSSQQFTMALVWAGIGCTGGMIYFGLYPISALFTLLNGLPVVIASYYFNDGNSEQLLFLVISGTVLIALVSKKLNYLFTVGSNQYKEQLTRADAMENLSKTDFLTKLNNRFGFYLDYEVSWESSVKNAQPLSLLLIEINQLSEIKHKHGHQCSDTCQIKLANMLKKTIRPPNILARYDSDQIMVAMPNTSLEDAIDTAKNINLATKDIEHTHNQEAILMTCSIGVISTLPKSKTDPGQLLKEVDKALIEAINRGEDNYFGYKL